MMLRTAATGLIVLGAGAFAVAGPEFHLDGPHMLESHRRATNLLLADFNDDGLTDIAAVSNDEALLDVWYRLAEPDDEGGVWSLEEYTLDRTVLDAVAMDADGDDLTDLVLAVAGSEIVLLRQTDKGRLQKAPNLPLRGERLVEGDLAGDGRSDLLVVEGRKFSVLERTGDGLAASAGPVFFSTSAPTSDPHILDLDGDGRNDLMYLTADSRESVAVRFQGADGGFPAEVALRTGGLRAATGVRRDDGRDRIATVSAATRQLVVHELVPDDLVAERWQPSIPGYVSFDPDRWDEKTASVAADVDGDGRIDIAATVPGSAVLRILRGTESGTMAPVDVPSLKDIRQMAPWPVAEGEPSPLLLLSGDEIVLGVATHESDAEGAVLPFPSPLAVGGEPLAVAVARSSSRSGAHALLIAEKKDDAIVLNRYAGFDAAAADTGVAEEVFSFGEDSEEPTAMFPADIDRDGRDDLFVFFEYEKPKVLLQSGAGRYEEAGQGGMIEGMLDRSTPARLSSGPLDGEDDSDILVVKDDFVRAFHLDDDGAPVIVAQLNAPAGRARFRAVTTGRFRDDERMDVAVLDAQGPALHVYGRNGESNVYEIVETVELAAADYQSLHAFDLDGDGREDLVAVASDRAAIVRGSRSGEILDSVVTLRTEIEEGGYGALHALDLDGDGRDGIVAVEMKENRLEFLRIAEGADNGSELEPFYHFRVFDSESSVARRVNLDAPPEPREIRAADLDGEGTADIAALVHDFVIVYYRTAMPSGSGPSPESAGD